MPIRHAIWKVGPQPEALSSSLLVNEALLENMIVAAPGLLSDEWMLIGRQEISLAGKIDLLGIAPDGALVLIELKRDRTPREVVAQALDYASWVEKLRAEEVDAIYRRFASGRSLAEDFRTRFGHDLDEDSLNQNHQIVIVAAALDDSTERIVAYLNERDVPINVLFFQVFAHGAEQMISRVWLLDPIHSPVVTPPDSWNGEFYVSFGFSDSRSWDDAVEYGFICAGGGLWYTRTLQLLGPGDRVWVKVPGRGFVGVGRVLRTAQPVSAFKVKKPAGEVPILEAAKRANYHREFVADPERCEYFVPVRWVQTVPLEKGFQEIGLFGNENTVCKPTAAKWRSTVERLKVRFPDYDK